jgi:hypothetical protein
LNKEDFENVWKSKWEASETKKKFGATEDEIITNIQMDYIFYRAILKQVYGLLTFE